MARAAAKAICAVYEIPYTEDKKAEINEMQLQLNYFRRLLKAIALQIKGLLLSTNKQMRI